MRNLFLVLGASLSLTAVASAQSSAEHNSVRAAVMDYVEGFYEGDTAKLVRSVSPAVYKFGYFVPRDSTRYRGEQMPWSEFLAYANRVKAQNRQQPAGTRKDVVIFDVLDQTASAR